MDKSVSGTPNSPPVLSCKYPAKAVAGIAWEKNTNTPDERPFEFKPSNQSLV